MKNYINIRLQHKYLKSFQEHLTEVEEVVNDTNMKSIIALCTLLFAFTNGSPLSQDEYCIKNPATEFVTKIEESLKYCMEKYPQGPDTQVLNCIFDQQKLYNDKGIDVAKVQDLFSYLIQEQFQDKANSAINQCADKVSSMPKEQQPTPFLVCFEALLSKICKFLDPVATLMKKR